MTLYAFYGSIEQGLVYGIMAIGVFITFRVLSFPDLTVDGSLPLGAAVGSMCITAGMSPFIALIPAMIAGFFAGLVTGFLTTRLQILHLLASIITMTALYSINIRIMGGKPNVALIDNPTVFDPFINMGLTSSSASLVVFGCLAFFVILFLAWLLDTEFGQALIATGSNPKMITSLGVNTHITIILGLGISNALVALTGALVAQNQGSADVSMGVGTIVAGLASVVIGETLFGTKNIWRTIISVLLGSIVYRFAIALALSVKIGNFSFTSSDLNLITATLVVLALVAPRMGAGLKAAQAKRKG